jgi:hypothetical protein
MHRAGSGIRKSGEEYLCELISSQVQFGLTYVGQARSAYEHGGGEHGEIARTIAMNAYSTANRFASRLIERTGDARLNGIEALRLQIESVWPDSTFAREIAS